ncbi:MAG: hypothetical protein ACKVT2_13780 [Saprospiraceae bacterium]
MLKVQHIEDIIAEGNTEAALDALLEAFRDTGHRQEIILLKSQFAELQSHHRAGILQYDAFHLGRNKINHALLGFIQSTQKEGLENKYLPQESNPSPDNDPFSFHKKMLPLIAQKLQKGRSFYQQSGFLVIVFGIGVIGLGIYLQNNLFHIGGGTLSSFSLFPFWQISKVNQQLVFIEGLCQAITHAPPKGEEAEKMRNTLMSLVQKNLNL